MRHSQLKEGTPLGTPNQPGAEPCAPAGPGVPERGARCSITPLPTAHPGAPAAGSGIVRGSPPTPAPPPPAPAALTRTRTGARSPLPAPRRRRVPAAPGRAQELPPPEPPLRCTPTPRGRNPPRTGTGTAPAPATEPHRGSPRHGAARRGTAAPHGTAPARPIARYLGTPWHGTARHRGTPWHGTGAPQDMARHQHPAAPCATTAHPGATRHPQIPGVQQAGSPPTHPPHPQPTRGCLPTPQPPRAPRAQPRCVTRYRHQALQLIAGDGRRALPRLFPL